MQIHAQQLSVSLLRSKAHREFHFVSGSLFNEGMKTAEENRRANLDKLIREAGGQKGLAERIGKSTAQISQWLNASKDSKTGKPRNMSPDTARELEKAMGKAYGWLDRDHSEDEPGIGSNAEPAPKLAPSRLIPVVGTAQLGDNGYWAELEYPVGHGDGYVAFPSRDPKAYAVRCRGDSMRPRIRDGEFVVVEPGSEPIPGDEVLVKAKDGRVMVKTYLYQRDGRVHLISVNEAHPPQSLALEDIETLHPVAAIVKKALWSE